MTKVKINNSGFTEIQTDVDTSKKYVTESIEEIWATNFSNLYNNFITNGFLEDLYKDAESKFNALFGGGTAIIGGGGAIVSGCAASAVAQGVTLAGIAGCIPVAGWIIAAIILAALAIIGIAYFVKSASDVQFKHDARDVFENLLTECYNGDQYNMQALENVETKMENVRLSLQSVLFQIADFQTKYANLESAAADAGVETQLAGDGTTLLGIQTEVTIDGETIETTTSEAMNAFFTYSDTVMNAEIAADFLQREYGYDVNFTDIVKNANAFMAQTLKSGLYSHEFVDALLPKYEAEGKIDPEAAQNQIKDITKLSLDEIKAMLANGTDIGQSLGLSGAMLGGALLGVLGKDPEDPGDGSQKPITPTPDPPNTGGGYYGGGYVTPTPTPGDEDDENDENEDKPDDTEDTDTESQLEEIVDIEIPEEEIKPDFGEVDYDQMARDEYEFGTPVEEIIEHRNELLASFEAAYESGDLTGLEADLQKYGYSQAEVDAILNDRFKCYKALLEGDERAILAEKAAALAAADGITDYQSHWSDKPNYDDLSSEGPSELLTLRSTDENIRQLKTDLDTARENYKTVADETNTLVKEASANKAKVDELKEKFDKEFGADESKWSKEAVEEYNEAVKASTESSDKVKELKEKFEEEYGTDTEQWSKEALEQYNEALKTKSESDAKVQELKEKYDKEYGTENSKWSKEAIAEYNDAVKAYNESANKVKEQLTKLDEAKTAYNENLEKFETAKEEYYKKLNQEDGSVVSDDGSNGMPDGTGAPDGSFNPDSNTSGDGITVSDTGIGVTDNGNSSGLGVMDSSDGTSNISGDLSNPLNDVFGASDNSNNNSGGVRVSDIGIGFDN